MNSNILYKTAFLSLVSILFQGFLIAQEEVIEETVVISAKYPVPLSEVIGSVDSISLRDIESRQVSDLRDLLDNTIGVSVTKDVYAGRTFNNTISIRGMGDKRVNLLIDGVRFGETYNGYGRDLVDTELLKRVEILKGPSSALYGSDGLAGAILYITKDPSDLATDNSFYQSLNAGYDSDNEHSKFSYLAANVGERMEGLIQITTRDLSETELHDDATKKPNPFSGKQSSIFLKGKYLISDNAGLTLTFDTQEWEGDINLSSDLGTSGYPQMISTTSALGDDDGSRDRVSLSFDFSAQSRLYDNGSLSIYSQETDQRQVTNLNKNILGNFVNGPRGPQFVPNIPPTPINEFKDYIFDQSIEGFALQFFKSLKSESGIRQNIVYGAEQESIDVTRPRYRTETNLLTQAINSNIGGELYPNKTFPDTETVRTAFFINNRIDISDKTSIVVGARHDSYELNISVDQLFKNVNPFGYSLVEQDDSKTSLKFGFIRDLGNDLSFFYQYAEGFRSPDFFNSNLSFTNFAFRYTIVPNPELGPEESEGHEFGLRGSTNNGNWSLAIYENDYKDFINSASTGFTNTGLLRFEYQNLESVNIKGIEFQSSFNVTENLSALFGFNSSTGEQEGIELTNIDPDQVIMGLLWSSPSGKLTIDSYIKDSDESPQGLPAACGRSGCETALELPGHVLLDSFLGYSVNNNLSIRLAIRNITDEKYWNWTSVAGSNASDSNLEYFLNPGRNYSLSIKYIF
jgi:hemoglobin/transferrin/lactoferrin receptor protein|tara:strand:- start:205 stop:2436 length:2232 start_codon:yes stop_codon:yes gene_type:complete